MKMKQIQDQIVWKRKSLDTAMSWTINTCGMADIKGLLSRRWIHYLEDIEETRK